MDDKQMEEHSGAHKLNKTSDMSDVEVGLCVARVKCKREEKVKIVFILNFFNAGGTADLIIRPEVENICFGTFCIPKYLRSNGKRILPC